MGGQGIEQVVGLKNEADLAANRDELPLAQPGELLAHQPDASLLHGAQGPDQGQQSGLARARGAGHDDQLAGVKVEVVVVQDLLAGLALTEPVIHVPHRDDRLDPHP